MSAAGILAENCRSVNVNLSDLLDLSSAYRTARAMTTPRRRTASRQDARNLRQGLCINLRYRDSVASGVSDAVVRSVLCTASGAVDCLISDPRGDSG